MGGIIYNTWVTMTRTNTVLMILASGLASQGRARGLGKPSLGVRMMDSGTIYIFSCLFVSTAFVRIIETEV